MIEFTKLFEVVFQTIIIIKEYWRLSRIIWCISTLNTKDVDNVNDFKDFQAFKYLKDFKTYSTVSSSKTSKPLDMTFKNLRVERPKRIQSLLRFQDIYDNEKKVS